MEEQSIICMYVCMHKMLMFSWSFKDFSSLPCVNELMKLDDVVEDLDLLSPTCHIHIVNVSVNCFDNFGRESHQKAANLDNMQQ